MKKLQALVKDQSGQTATEYMLIIGVIVAAILAAAYLFVPKFKEGVETLGDNIKKTLSEGFKSK